MASVELIDNGTLQSDLIKHVDPAIVHFSSTTDLTRYDKVDLISLKDGKIAQQPPSCYYDPNIIRLNILKYKNRHTEEMEAQMKVFREKLQNIAFSNWDPNLLQLLRNYHNALLNPFYNHGSYAGNQNQVQPMFNPVNQQQTQQQFQSPRRVSFVEKQQAVLDKIPSYDRNMNFFDNITTTATMRPPRIHMGVNSYNNNNNNNNNYHKRPNNNNNYNNNPNYSRKPYSCANEHANSYTSSAGYYSGNDTKSSFEESVHERPCEKRMGFFDKMNMEKNKFEANKKPVQKNEDEEEKEPEWFNVPATLEDFIDLHGFDDDDDANIEKKESSGSADSKQNEYEANNFKNPINHDYQEHQNRQHNPNNSYNRYNNGYTNNNNISNGSNYNNRGMNYNRPPNQGYNQNVNNGNQRFRNPLHFNRPARQAVPPIVNPFFDAWRNGKFLNQPQVSFTELMEQNNFPKNLPSTAMHMNEVENRMKQHQNINGFNQVVPPTAVPQFFQNLAANWGVRVNEIPHNGIYQQQQQVPINMGGHQPPTQEQLQKFTSEIMRNAILRKNQQYHDENNYQK